MQTSPIKEPPRTPKKKIHRGLNLKWCKGLNYKLPNSVINLTNSQKKEIFYISGHIGIFYDYENNTQRLLQGHSNEITAIIYNKNKEIIVTADKGESCMMIIWSEKRGIPLKTFFDPDEEGIKCIDISEKGDLILSLSVLRNNSQCVRVWKWETYGDKNGVLNSEEIVVNLKEDCFEFIKWNYNDYNEFVTTGKKAVRFWKRDNKGCSSYSPLVVKKDGKKKSVLKEFSQTVFIPENKGAQAITATLDGNLIVWDVILILEEFANVNNRREIKSINLLNNSNKKYGDKNPGISLLNIFDNIIIIGTTVGTVRFYDFRFRIICWFEDLYLGTITSISFSNEVLLNEESQDDFTEDMDEIVTYPDFVVCDTGARVHLLKTKLFQEIEPKKRKGKLLLHAIQHEILWMTVDSKSEKIAISCKNECKNICKDICKGKCLDDCVNLCKNECKNGVILEWNFWNYETKVIKDFKFDNQNEEFGTCIEYSPDNKYLIVGTNQGNLYIKLEENENFSSTPLLISSKKKGIKCEKLIFSSCSKYLAVSDDHKCVTLFKLGHKYDDKTQPIEWVFSGKMRFHTLKITDILFSSSKNNFPRLFSIGADMYLVEYNVEKSKEKLFVQSFTKIESNFIPTSCMIYPEKYMNEECVLVADAGYKLKIWANPSQKTEPEKNDTKKICYQTCLGPSFGGSITSLKLLDNCINKKFSYLAFSTDYKVLGIIKLPLNGNPNNSIGLLSNPGKISHMCVSNNGKYVITSGGGDLSMNIFEVDYKGLEQNELLNLEIDDPLDIYPDLLEGGKNGNLYRDLKDFFYYSQIRKEKENTTKAHKLDGKIPLKEIPNLMIALGHYPSSKEIENMKNEVKFSRKDEKIIVNNLSLKNFVKLFINHRSTYGLTQEYISSELEPIFDSNGKISRKEIIDLLTNYGEEFETEEIEKYLNLLLGEGSIDNILPEKIDLKYLVEDLLGFENQG